MLMFTSVVTEITSGKPRHMMVFSSPRNPGSLFKVETDTATAHRLRALINSVVNAATAVAEMLGQDEDNPHHDPFNRG